MQSFKISVIPVIGFFVAVFLVIWAMKNGISSLQVLRKLLILRIYPARSDSLIGPITRKPLKTRALTLVILSDGVFESQARVREGTTIFLTLGRTTKCFVCSVMVHAVRVRYPSVLIPPNSDGEPTVLLHHVLFRIVLKRSRTIRGQLRGCEIELPLTCYRYLL